MATAILSVQCEQAVFSGLLTGLTHVLWSHRQSASCHATVKHQSVVFVLAPTHIADFLVLTTPTNKFWEERKLILDSFHLYRQAIGLTQITQLAIYFVSRLAQAV
jgi:hypothetical protein